ncbi:unnamed protein product, partial [Adineta ricciae]
MSGTNSNNNKPTYPSRSFRLRRPSKQAEKPTAAPTTQLPLTTASSFYEADFPSLEEASLSPSVWEQSTASEKPTHSRSKANNSDVLLSTSSALSPAQKTTGKKHNVSSVYMGTQIPSEQSYGNHSESRAVSSSAASSDTMSTQVVTRPLTP